MNYGTKELDKALNDLRKVKKELKCMGNSYLSDIRLLGKNKFFDKKYYHYLQYESDEDMQLTEGEFYDMEMFKTSLSLIAYTNHVWHVIAYGLHHWHRAKNKIIASDITTKTYSRNLRYLYNSRKKYELNIEVLEELKNERHRMIHSVRPSSVMFIIDYCDEICQLVGILEHLIECYIRHDIICIDTSTMEGFDSMIQEYKREYYSIRAELEMDEYIGDN